MHRYIVILVAALGVLISLCAPASAASANYPFGQNCNVFSSVSTEELGHIAGNGVLYFNDVSGDEFCNTPIRVNGQFEIYDISASISGGCLAVNTTTGYVVEDPDSACQQDGGNGYPWDRWTAISIEYHSNQLWMFQSAYNGYCIYDDPSKYGEAAIYNSCNNSSHDEWYSWPNSNL